MSSQIARVCVDVLGSCRLLHVGGKTPDLLIDLLQSGCDAWATGDVPLRHPRWVPVTTELAIGAAGSDFDAFVLELPPGADIRHWLAALAPRFGDPQALVLLAGGQPRDTIDRALFDIGWRRHPAGLRAADFAALNDAKLGPISVYQRIPEAAAARWPVADLEAGRDLHMDLLRESGGRADAYIAQYAHAAAHVRTGDYVLDCACGLGYGTAILASLSPGSSIVGVDRNAAAIAYAESNYGRHDVSFRVGDAANLEGMADASVDVIVSIDTLAYAADWQAVIREFHRVLRPDGRLIVSVPERWTDATGRASNPQRVHVFDWPTLEAGLSDRFIIDTRCAQMAPGGVRGAAGGRAFGNVELDAKLEADWIMVIASANPFEAGERELPAFVHPAFDSALKASGAAVVDFGHGYDNPYLYRSMVQIGERLNNVAKLSRLALLVANHGRAGSADQGAAICVLGYHVLEKQDAVAAPEVMDHLRQYLEATADEQNNPHVVRWRLSLEFLAARLSEMCGDQDQALHWYDIAAHGNWRQFSALLATKSVAAAFCAGRLHLTRGNEAAAKACFAHGLGESLAAIRSDPSGSVGDPDHPIPFGLTKLAEVADMGAQCAYAMTYLPLWRRDPGMYWRKIDVKRFGLITSLKSLEQENAQLRKRLNAA